MTTTTLSDIQAPAHAPRGFGLFLRLLAANWTWGRLTLKLPDGAMHDRESSATFLASWMLASTSTAAARSPTSEWVSWRSTVPVPSSC